MCWAMHIAFQTGCITACQQCEHLTTRCCVTPLHRHPGWLHHPAAVTGLGLQCHPGPL